MRYQGRRARDDTVLSDCTCLAASWSGLVPLADTKAWDEGPIHVGGCEDREGRETFLCPEGWCCREKTHS